MNRKLPDVINNAANITTKDTVSESVDQKVERGEEMVTAEEGFLSESDIKGERSCVISSGGVRGVHRGGVRQHHAIFDIRLHPSNNNNNQSVRVSKENSDRGLSRLQENSDLRIESSYSSTPSHPRLPRPQDILEPLPKPLLNHLQPCSINIILNTIAEYGLDKVS